MIIIEKLSYLTKNRIYFSQQVYEHPKYPGNKIVYHIIMAMIKPEPTCTVFSKQ